MEYILIKKDNSPSTGVLQFVRSFLINVSRASGNNHNQTRMPSSACRHLPTVSLNYGQSFFEREQEANAAKKWWTTKNIGEQRTSMDQFLVHQFIILAAKRKVRLVTQAQQAFGPHRRDCRDSCCSL